MPELTLLMNQWCSWNLFQLQSFSPFFKHRPFILVFLLIQGNNSCDNTNVESRTWSVVNYVINNIMSTALTGRRKTATYLHLVRELLYKIEWPSVRRLRIGISCTYWHFVRVTIFCDWFESECVGLWESDWHSTESVRALNFLDNWTARGRPLDQNSILQELGGL